MCRKMCIQEHAFETTSCAVAAAQQVPAPAAKAELTSDVGYGCLETEAILTNVGMRVVGSMQRHHVLSMQAHFRDLANLLGMLICNAHEAHTVIQKTWRACMAPFDMQVNIRSLDNSLPHADLRIIQCTCSTCCGTTDLNGMHAGLHIMQCTCSTCLWNHRPEGPA